MVYKTTYPNPYPNINHCHSINESINDIAQCICVRTLESRNDHIETYILRFFQVIYIMLIII